MHEAVPRILSDVGVVLAHDGARELLICQHGCSLGDDGYLRMPPEVVEQALSTVPKVIRLYDLNGNVRVDTGARVTTAYGSLTVKCCAQHLLVRVTNAVAA